MGEDPDAIRNEIVETRLRMGETIDALGDKTDVKGRAKESVAGAVGTVKEKVGLAGEKASDTLPDPEQVKGGAKRAAGMAQENPLGLTVGALAVGFLIGSLIPASKVENEKIGPVADQVKDQLKETGGEALQHGKEVAQAAVQSATETVKDEGGEHAQQLADSAREHAESVRG
jgi:hypothetical protein